MNGLRKVIITGLGTGYLPVAPGTWGSAAVAAIYVAAAAMGCRDHASTAVNAVMLAVLAAASIGCIALGPFAERAFGRKDPSQVSLDEWAGQALTYLLLPVGAGVREVLIVAAAGFVAFRVFDIVKPPPARQAEKLPTGVGILVDDLIAAVYANVVCQVVFRVLLNW